MTNLKDGILYNVENCIALSGDGKTDGSRRISIDPDTNTPIVEKLIDGIWQPASFEFGPDTVWIGKAAGLAAAGHHILTENVDGEFHLLPHSDFNGEVSQSDTKTLFSYYFSQNQIAQEDYSNEWIGTSFSWTAQSDTRGLLKKGGETLDFEDTDFNCVKQCVNSMRWGSVHREIVEFVDYISGLQSAS